MFLRHILYYAEQGVDMLNRRISSGDYWVHHYQPQSKRASVLCEPIFTFQHRIQSYTHSRQGYSVMFTVFRDCKGGIFA